MSNIRARSWWTSRPLVVSQTRTWPSWPPAAPSRPSGLHAAAPQRRSATRQAAAEMVRGERPTQCRQRLRRVPEVRRLHRKQQVKLRIVSELEQRLGGQLARAGDLALVPSVVALHQRNNPTDDRDHQQQREQGHGAASESDRPAMLADVLPNQLVLCQTVQGRCQLAHTVPKARVPHGHISVVPRPTQVHPQRLERKPTTQARRDGCCHIEVAGGVIPAKLAVCKSDQNGFVAPMCAPPTNLLVNPVRSRSLGRSQQHEVARPRERPLDRWPQLRGSRQTGLVAKDAQGSPSVPRLGERLQDPPAAQGRAGRPQRGCMR